MKLALNIFLGDKKMLDFFKRLLGIPAKQEAVSQVPYKVEVVAPVVTETMAAPAPVVNTPPAAVVAPEAVKPKAPAKAKASAKPKKPKMTVAK